MEEIRGAAALCRCGHPEKIKKHYLYLERRKTLNMNCVNGKIQQRLAVEEKH